MKKLIVLALLMVGCQRVTAPKFKDSEILNKLYQRGDYWSASIEHLRCPGGSLDCVELILGGGDVLVSGYGDTLAAAYDDIERKRAELKLK